MFTPKEIALRLDRNPGTIRLWVQKGLLPAKRLSPHRQLIKLKDAKLVDRQHASRPNAKGNNHPRVRTKLNLNAKPLPEPNPKVLDRIARDFTPDQLDGSKPDLGTAGIETRLVDLGTELFEIRKLARAGAENLCEIARALTRLADAWEGKKGA